jgi:predicted acyltransferase
VSDASATSAVASRDATGPGRSALRFASVDALRGLAVAAMLLVNDAGDWTHVVAPLDHSAWNGCTFADLIFPVFLFVAGLSIALAIETRLLRGADRAALARDVLWRATRIVALGLALHLVAAWSIAGRDVRLLGVLQRIGFCYAAAALLAIYARPRVQWVIVAAILVGYWALLALGGSLAPDVNLADRVDTAMLGRFAYAFDPATGRAHDPEGVLATLPSIATTLLGVRIGAWLRDGATRRIVVAGIAMLALGASWSFVLPLNKPLWTPSFVLWTAGIASLALVIAHAAIDVRGWPALGRSFGVNAIAAYAGAWLMACAFEALGIGAPLYRALFADWMTPRFGPYAPSLAYAAAVTGVWWGVMRVLDARGVRIKI